MKRLLIIIFIIFLSSIISTSFASASYEGILLYEEPYNREWIRQGDLVLTLDPKGNIWIVDVEKKRARILTPDKKILESKELNNLGKKIKFFDLLAVNKDYFLFPDSLYDRNKKKKVLNFPPHTSSITVSAGFTKDGGVFINSIPAANDPIIVDRLGNILFPPFSKKNKGIFSFYYDPFRNRNIAIIRDNKGSYLKVSSTDKKARLNYSEHFIFFVDKNGFIYLFDGYFKVEGDSDKSVLAIIDSNQKLKNRFIFHRKWSKNSWSLYEELFGVNKNGDIYFLRYSEKKIKIFVLRKK